ncbi:MAG: VCBS repeat-containing protein [Thermoanaerobaculia bacterium]
MEVIRGRRAFAPSALFISVLLSFPACVHRDANPPRVGGPVDPRWKAGDFGEPGPRSARDWKKDSNGDRYYVVAIPNDPSRYRWLDSDTVRYGSVAAYKVERFDAKFLYVKFYEIRAATPKAATTPTPVRHVEAPAPSASPRFKFVTISDGLPRTGQWRNGFSVGDIDGDGHPDLVHGPARKSGGAPAIFLGDGKGRWKRDAFSRFPPLMYDYGDTALADFNGDGKLDLALGIHLRGLAVLVNDGKNVFTSWSSGLGLRRPNEPGTEPHFSSRAIAVGDWNGDGRPDLIALSDGPRPGPAQGPSNATSVGFRVYLNGGDGTWVKQTEQPDPLFGDDLAVGDVDKDGHLDAVTSTSAIGFKSIFKHGKGDGWESRELDGFPANALVRSVALGDFDRDGFLDVVVSYSAPEGDQWLSGIDIYFFTKSGFTRRAVIAVPSREGFGAVATGDLDGDGALDLVALRADGSVHTFAGDRKGFVSPDAVIPTPEFRSGCGGSHVVLADIDGNGRKEILATFSGEQETLSGLIGCRSGGAIEAWTLRP